MPCAHPTLLGSAAHGDTGTHVAAQAGGSSCADTPVLWCFADKTMGVFHLQSPRRKYDFTYEQAQAACAAEGASLATFQQLGAAQQVRAGVALSPHGAGTRHAPPGARASPGVTCGWVLTSPQPGPVCSIQIHQTGGLAGLASTLGWDL